MAGTTVNPTSSTPSNRPSSPQAPPGASRRSSLARYLHDSRIELKKVTWPTREQTVNLTIVVCVVCVVVALFLGGVDFIFASLVKALSNS